jgi:hypothetical protein
MRRTGGKTGSASGNTARQGFEMVGTVLDEVLRGLKLETRFAAAEATERWSSVVGPEVVARTRGKV